MSAISLFSTNRIVVQDDPEYSRLFIAFQSKIFLIRGGNVSSSGSNRRKPTVEDSVLFQTCITMENSPGHDVGRTTLWSPASRSGARSMIHFLRSARIDAHPIPFPMAKNSNVMVNRSEERRVGKECRSRWSPYH